MRPSEGPDARTFPESLGPVFGGGSKPGELTSQLVQFLGSSSRGLYPPPISPREAGVRDLENLKLSYYLFLENFGAKICYCEITICELALIGTAVVGRKGSIKVRLYCTCTFTVPPG